MGGASFLIVFQFSKSDVLQTLKCTVTFLPSPPLKGVVMQESENLDDSQQLEAIEEDRQSLRSLRWTWVSWRRHDHDDGGYPGYPGYMLHNVLAVLHHAYHTLWAQQGVGSFSWQYSIHPEKRFRFEQNDNLLQDWFKILHGYLYNIEPETKGDFQ